MNKIIFAIPLLLVLVVPVAFAEGFSLEFPNHNTFTKGEAIFVFATIPNFDYKSPISGIVLDNTGKSIGEFEFFIERYNIDESGGVRIETDNSNYQTGILYTVIGNYQGQEKQLQFTLSGPPPTVEELSMTIQSQQEEVSSELEDLRAENAELRQLISDLNERIDGLLSQIANLNAIVHEQINVMMQFFR